MPWSNDRDPGRRSDTPCGAPRHLTNTDPPPAEHGAHLCRPCRHQLARDLARIPHLDTDLRHILATHHNHGHGDGTGLPYNGPVSELRSQLRHDTAWWARHCATLRETPSPALNLPALCAWLEQLAQPPRPWIPYQPFAPDLAGAMADNRARAIALLDPWIRKQFPVRGPDGICPACNHGRLHVTVYASDGDRRRSYTSCDGCGQRWEPEQWLRLGQRIIHRREETPALCETA
jgi:hypothetical protein